MIFVIGWVHLEAGGVDKLRDVAINMVEATNAENGCIAYSFASDLVAPDIIRITECWTDDTALTNHFRTPHMAKFNAELEKVGILAADVRAYSGQEVRQLIRK